MRFFYRSLLVLGLMTACAKSSTLVESRPLTADFDVYRSGAVEVDPTNMEGGVKGSQELLTYLEGKLKQGGVLEPLAAEKGAQLLIRIRATANAGEDDMRLLVDFVDAKNGETIGQVAIVANTLGAKNSGPALRRVADEIVGYMRTHRGVPVSAKAGPGGVKRVAASAPTALAPSGAATDRPPGPGVLTSAGCTTTCTPDSSSALSAEERNTIATNLQPMLKDVRVCLDRVSAQEIHPAVIVRFESNGQMSQLKVDAGGYDDLSCVHEVRSRPPNVSISREASVRCEYRCRR
jgi:hypothetical protein